MLMLDEATTKRWLGPQSLVVNFLLKKFDIDKRDQIVGTSFGRWARFQRPQQKAGKPKLNGRTWEAKHDPWRGISRTAFSADYFQRYEVGLSTDTSKDLIWKMMELNSYDHDDNPYYAYDIYLQRVSCYIQHQEVVPEMSTSPDIENPYLDRPPYASDLRGRRRSQSPKLRDLDNGSLNEVLNFFVADKAVPGNAIIIFDNSHSGSIRDTLIRARQSSESRWRRLPFYLAYDAHHDMSNDQVLALECTRLVLQDVFKNLVRSWDRFLDISGTHVSILEDKIYEQPADETRAPELWANSSQWLKAAKLISIHMDIVKEMKIYLLDLTETEGIENKWLDPISSDIDRIKNSVNEDLVKPTAALADLMYKSVGIRDSRHSLRLGTSMWRLSWITFIFLPLTFIVGFFGMNVIPFQKDSPSIKWYFIAAVPFMLCVLIFWYLLKHLLARNRPAPYTRGIYDHMFHDLATNNPALWSRKGPRTDIPEPRGFTNKLKWYLIRHWTWPHKTTSAVSANDEDANSMGAWFRFKRFMIKRWTAEIQETMDPFYGFQSGEPASLEAAFPIAEDASIVSNGVGKAIELLAMPGTTVLEDQQGGFPKLPLSPKIRVERPVPAGRPGTGEYSHSRGSSRGSDGVMVEEKKADLNLKDLLDVGHS
ncbi:MAG: hypothetical protein M1819_006790 [Sarea resinae]|nr:MAG: hypothetical protein M1819_006790 [Sarea resinae]